MLVLSDDFADQDLIGHADYCDGLVELIRSVDSRGSFTIGIYGQWGSGKTSMLKQIKKALGVPESEDAQPVLTVWFNPWQFVADEHLIIPFFHTLIASLEKIVKEQKTEKIAKKLPDFIKKIAHVPLALIYGLEGELKIPLLLKTKFAFAKAMDYQQNAEAAIDEESAIENETAMQNAAGDYESTYYNLLQILQDAAADLDMKIVVFIDDLDRCLPEKAVQLLEGLKVLLDLRNFVFVMGVAQEVIERGIRVRYKELYLAGPQDDLPNIEGQYLDKIIQFPFSLPAADTDELKKNILTRQLKNLEGAEPFVELIHEVLGSNPRTIKRFINTISFSLNLAGKKSEKENAFHPELLIKASLIGYLFPSLYRQLEIYPSHLVRLEKIVMETEKERKKNKSKQEFVEGQSHQVKKTDLPIIDQWLEDDKISKLLLILKIRDHQIGFKDQETVIKYVCLLTTSIRSEVTSKAKDTRISNKPLPEEMRDRMVEIPAGKFIMGDNESGQVEVTISRSFMMDKYPVTQALYQKVMNNNPSSFKGEDRPVENVSWFDAIEFCNELSKRIGLHEVYEVNGKKVKRRPEANGYRLPTEAEWEYACRANTTGDHYGNLDEIAWYDKNSGDQTQGVGQKKANDFGLYDMLGNVWEWCNDWYGDYPTNPVTDSTGAEDGSYRVLRGGSWRYEPGYVRSADRGRNTPGYRDGTLGFRLLLPPGQ
ncbi:MAG: SUMF1/EgtB/PvdO family nonheme iron enzyme [Thermodesulfobacteriota bacterium]|nr:SUMF1/EgtB/PvdO family nonheme iron enzyme [Thermodesulfobacteriota bacterium]